MILVCGIPSEAAIARLSRALEERHASFLMLNQRHLLTSTIELVWSDDRVTGTLVYDGQRVELEEVGGIFLRFMDDGILPELQNEPPASPIRLRVRRFHDLLVQWCEVTQARVINRYSAMGSNYSKPYQLQLIAAQGFRVPDTLVTNQPDLVQEFVSEHGRVIYKSISSERSIVQELSIADLDRLDLIRWCPVQFQAFVPGDDVRVHTIGERVFATRVVSNATDYRYAHRQTGTDPDFVATDLSDDLAARCVKLSAALGLDMAGIDLRLGPDGEAYCFEVNPTPAYSYYEALTGQPIASAVAEYLMRRGECAVRQFAARPATPSAELAIATGGSHAME